MTTRHAEPRCGPPTRLTVVPLPRDQFMIVFSNAPAAWEERLLEDVQRRSGAAAVLRFDEDVEVCASMVFVGAVPPTEMAEAPVP